MLNVFVVNNKIKLETITPLKIPNATPRILSKDFVTEFKPEIFRARYTAIKYTNTIITINEIKLKSFGSIFKKANMFEILSLYLVARNSPEIIPANEKIPRSIPFFNPSSAEINTTININMSGVFKTYIIEVW